MGTFSIWHWVIVLVVVVLIFGTGKLRNMGKDLGGAVKDFKKGMNDGKAEDTSSQSTITQSNDEGEAVSATTQQAEVQK